MVKCLPGQRNFLNQSCLNFNAAVEKIANSEGIIIIFDVATSPGIIYNNSAYDLSQKVIKLLNQ